MVTTPMINMEYYGHHSLCTELALVRSDHYTGQGFATSAVLQAVYRKLRLIRPHIRENIVPWVTLTARVYCYLVLISKVKGSTKVKSLFANCDDEAQQGKCSCPSHNVM